MITLAALLLNLPATSTISTPIQTFDIKKMIFLLFALFSLLLAYTHSQVIVNIEAGKGDVGLYFPGYIVQLMMVMVLE